MNISTMVTIGTLVTSLAGGGWYAHEQLSELARKDELQLLASKANTALDNQMEDLIAKIARLEAKTGKSQEELEQLQYWRALLERLRRTRSQH